MSIHVVNKGKNGEREVCKLLDAELEAILATHTFDEKTVELVRAVVQRNQNQSAVGGGDINLFGLSIEVKRQETLAIEQWWNQAVKSAARNNDMPVLIYRQNNKKWNVVMPGYLMLPENALHYARVQVNLETFQAWFRAHALAKIMAGDLSRV